MTRDAKTAPGPASSSAPSSAPDDDLPLRLLTGLEKVGLVLRGQAWLRSSERGLTPTQGHILSLLLARGAEPVRLSDAARSLSVSAPTASDAVAALERKGLLSRRASRDDARASHLRLTRKGKAAAQRARLWPEPTLAAIRSLPDQEQRALLGGLARLLRALEAAGRLPTTRVCPDCRNFQPNARPGADRPHRCSLLNVELAEGDVRFDCPSHAPSIRNES